MIISNYKNNNVSCKQLQTKFYNQVANHLKGVFINVFSKRSSKQFTSINTGYI